jgi:hypothetical protein
VREAVLVEGEQARLVLATAPEPRRPFGIQGRGDDGEIEWHPIGGEEVYKREQPLGLPAGVIVAEEERARARRRVQLTVQRLEPGSVSHR